MIINTAQAADAAPATTTATTLASSSPATPLAHRGAQGDAFLMNVGMVLVLAVLFYVLLIRPQQKRFKQHEDMISKMDRGTKVVTQGGLVGVIDKVVSDHEVVIDFGNNVRITMMRSYIIGRYDDAKMAPANDDKKNKKDKSSK